MILTGKQILENVKAGKIYIDDFSESRLNPNSYNLKLGDTIATYERDQLDMATENRIKEFPIPKEGFILRPGKLYLARTKERTATNHFVPLLEGRSSVGRLGLCIHVTAGFGDAGFDGYWTLELSVVQPLVIYPNVEICQIYYHAIDADNVELYGAKGKYNNNQGIQPSMMYKEFNPETKEYLR